MDRQRDAMVNRGLTQLHTSLGILLGAGRISEITHEKVITLINADDNASVISSAGHDTPAYAPSSGLENGFGNLRLGNKPPRGPGKSASSVSPEFINNNKWLESTNSTAVATNTQSDARSTNIICPWFATAGYGCREHEKGNCGWAHEDIPNGMKDPLICSFWADGERCTKSKDQCRFAHYWAAHREIAPQPSSKYKKQKRNGVPRDMW